MIETPNGNGPEQHVELDLRFVVEELDGRLRAAVSENLRMGAYIRQLEASLRQLRDVLDAPPPDRLAAVE